MNNFFVYKLNQFEKNEFKINKSSDVNNFFVLNDFNKISNQLIFDILKRKRKIIIHNESIINVNKLKNLLSIFYRNNQESLLSNLFISKECFLDLQEFVEYEELNYEIEFINKINKNNMIKADNNLNCAIKIKDIENQKKLNEKIDRSLFIKNIILEKFNLKQVEFYKVMKQLIYFYKIVESNLIYSTAFLIEKHRNSSSYFYFIDEENIENFKVMNATNVGLISAFDYGLKPYSCVELKNKKAFWIDLVQIRNKILKLNINHIIIENIHLYDNFEEIKVCTKYCIDNEIITEILPDKDLQNIAYPLYSKFDGWQKNINIVEDKKDLPMELLYFMNELKKLLKVQSVTVVLEKIEITI